MKPGLIIAIGFAVCVTCYVLAAVLRRREFARVEAERRRMHERTIRKWERAHDLNVGDDVIDHGDDARDHGAEDRG